MQEELQWCRVEMAARSKAHDVAMAVLRVAAFAIAATAFTPPRQLPRRVLRTSASASDAVCPLLSEPTSPVATFAMG